MTTATETTTSTVTVSTQYTDPSNRTWDLNRALLDYHAAGWAWDGQPYSPAAGPLLRAVADPSRLERLLALACCSGLWQVPLDAAQDLAHWMDTQDDAFRRCARTAATA